MKKNLVVLLATASAILNGCVQTRITEPKRSAVEQLLISTAADRALDHVDFSILAGRKVFVDSANFESHDKPYAISSIREAVNEAGGLLVSDFNTAEVVLEPRSGALSTDSSSSVVGVPSTPLPIPMAGTFVTPEVSVFKSQKQLSVAKIALFSYERESGKHLQSTGPLVGHARHNYYTFLGFFKYTSTTIPEKKRGMFQRDQE
jgi:hypothetical protein